VVVELLRRVERILASLMSCGYLESIFYNLTASYCPVVMLIAWKISPNAPSDSFLMILYFLAIKIYISPY
jgi:hypothetical protein